MPAVPTPSAAWPITHQSAFADKDSVGIPSRSVLPLQSTSWYRIVSIESISAIPILAAPTPNVKRKTRLRSASVCPVSKEILTSAVNRNAPPIRTVPTVWPVSLPTVAILVQDRAVSTPGVKWSATTLSARVHRAMPVIHSSNARSDPLSLWLNSPNAKMIPTAIKTRHVISRNVRILVPTVLASVPPTLFAASHSIGPSVSVRKDSVEIRNYSALQVLTSMFINQFHYFENF